MDESSLSELTDRAKNAKFAYERKIGEAMQLKAQADAADEKAQKLYDRWQGLESQIMDNTAGWYGIAR